MDEQDLWSIELVPIVHIYQIQLESIFVSLVKPQLTKEPQALINGTHRTIEPSGRIQFA
jgi:hypothetical protein